MKLKMSALVSEVSKGLNGSYAARSQYGQVLRKKPGRPKPATATQSFQRSTISFLYRRFWELTPAEQNTWIAAAGDRMGGFHLFINNNRNLALVGQPLVDVLKDEPVTPDFDFVSFAFSAVHDQPAYTTDPMNRSGYTHLFSVSRPLSAGVTNGWSYANIGAVPTTFTGASAHYIGEWLLKRYGSQNAPGKYFLRAYAVQNNSGCRHFIGQDSLLVT